ncbi:MAG TPA: DUF6351 family protein [Sporichthyaceae bacterium]|nr:DUF6351 family protein [Sporichthyaceae bacterium]
MRNRGGSRLRWAALAGVAVGSLLLGTVVNTAQADQPGPGLGIKVLSNRADLISGGDAYVEITEPAGVRVDRMRITLDGKDANPTFARRPDGRVTGLIEGMSVGEHIVAAHASHLKGAWIKLTNHPISGPILTGPQPQPYYCTTAEHGLGAPQDAACNVPVRYDWYYLPTDLRVNTLQPYNPAHPASDVRRVTTDQGHTVPFIVRDERGVMDRGIYDITVLYDPTKPWAPWAAQDGWNRKAVFRAGASCGTGHVQGDFHDAALKEGYLQRGFAVITSGTANFAYNCNDVAGVEALMMLKERLVEQYGEIRYTIGEGCSGGSIAVIAVAANYPGLLDGIMPSCGFPDLWGVVQSGQDCALMTRHFQLDGRLWTKDADQAAATGFASPKSCSSMASSWKGMLDPWKTSLCTAERMPGPHPVTDTRWVYDPVKNPTGARCSLQDFQEPLFGLRPDGKANRPYDNVGVQYGLKALASGAISVEQFLDLNANAGGYDIDGGWQPQRSVADPDGLSRAYRGGRVINAAELASVPIVNVRGYVEDGFHTTVEDLTLRYRLLRDTGSTGNQVIRILPLYHPFLGAFDLLDEWLSAIEADHSERTTADKVLADRPADAVDGCVTKSEELVTDPARCLKLYPMHAKPRLTAGGPLTEDVLKCQLRPAIRSDYPAQMTVAQFSRLLAIFPDGVCDWSKAGVDQAPPIGTWQSYQAGPDAVPLGPPPVAKPVD